MKASCSALGIVAEKCIALDHPFALFDLSLSVAWRTDVPGDSTVHYKTLRACGGNMV